MRSVTRYDILRAHRAGRISTSDARAALARLDRGLTVGDALTAAVVAPFAATAVVATAAASVVTAPFRFVFDLFD